MELYLHIGTEKTGSSFIQTLCARNRDFLKDFGIFFPSAGKRERDMVAGRISPGNASELSKLIEQRNKQKVLEYLKTRYLKGRKQGCRKLLLSNERLAGVLSTKGNIEWFVQQCKTAGFEPPQFLLILRDPVDQALSLYKHRSKRGTTPDIEGWLKTGYRLPEELSGFFEQTDSGQVTVRKYMKDSKYMGRVFFNDWLCVESPSDHEDREVNPSLTLSELHVLKQIQRLDTPLTNPFYDFMLQVPGKEKSDDRFLKKYHIGVIRNYLIQSKNVWHHCNGLLPENEQLELPDKHESVRQEDRFLSFSIEQTNAWIEFQKQSRSCGFRRKLFFNSRIRPVLSKIKHLIIPRQ